MRAHDYQGDLEEIDLKVIQLFALVSDGITATTDALLASDREAATVIAERDRVVDALYLDIEDLIQRQFALQAPVAGDMRYLLSMLRIVPEIERSGDLVEHIARRAMRGLAGALTPRGRGLVERMGKLAAQLWVMASTAYRERDAEAFSKMHALDDELDDLHVALTAEVVESEPATPMAMEMALVARFYERLGDHAVHIAARLRYSARGITNRPEPVTPPSPS